MDRTNLDKAKREIHICIVTMDTTNLDKVKKERQVLEYYNGYDKSR